MSNISKRDDESAFSAAKRKLLNDDDFVCKNKESSRGYVDNESCSTKSRKKKKENKSKKKKSKEKRTRSSSESSSSSQAKVEKVDEPKAKDREDWMSMTGAFATYSRKDVNPEELKMNKTKGQIDAYNPSQCSRELNPYWKNGGSGLPPDDQPANCSKQEISHRSERDKHSSRDSWSKSLQFKKPDYDDNYRHNRRERRHDGNDNKHSFHEVKRNWKKHPEQTNRNRSPSPQREERKEHREERQNSPTKYGNSVPQASSSQGSIKEVNETQEACDYLTDQQMNTLGARIIKAEILGNTTLIAQLTRKLDAARMYKKLHPEGPPDGLKEEDGIMLTMTDERGNTRPLTKAQQAGDPRSKGGKKKASTHSDAGDRMKFFADDDKYTLKDMFEKEKFGNAEENDKEFVQIISKHKNPNDDLEDIFAESITKNKSEAKRDEDNMKKAVAQHKRTQRSLNNCDYCIDSDRMIKHMMVSLGSKAYVALPTRKSLTEGHCFISTVGHVACSTMVDEDVWTEILSYRRALTRMFSSRDEDVVFFETATYFHKLPHIVIHCVPLPRDVGDTAPIYFKKALLECEAEWSNNKKVVDLRGKDIRRGVPKGLPYFWIDFGMDAGFAHVIEDQQLFPMNFAQEIVGGMLDLDHSLWRKPQKENFENQRKKVLQFTEEWKKFDPEASS